MANENLSTYTAVGSAGVFTLGTSAATFTAMRRDAVSYAYYDFGSNYFADFNVNFEAKIDSGIGIGIASLFSISNTAGTIQDQSDANDGIVVSVSQNNDNLRFDLTDHSTDDVDSYIDGGTSSDLLYFNVERVDTTTTAKIYTDSARTSGSLLDTLIITCENGDKQYFHVLGSRDTSGSGSDTITGYTQNFEILEFSSTSSSSTSSSSSSRSSSSLSSSSSSSSLSSSSSSSSLSSSSSSSSLSSSSTSSSSSSTSSSSSSTSSSSSSSSTSSSSSSSTSSSSSSTSSSSSSSSTSLVIPSLKHFWYKLLDDEGVPRGGEPVYIYKAGTTDAINIYDKVGLPISNPVVTLASPTASAGIFEFFIKDEMWNNVSPTGYEWDQRIKIQWDHDGTDKYSDNIMTWGEFYPVFDQPFAPSAWSETPSGSVSDADKNKAYSNLEAYKIERHTASELEADITAPSAGNSWVHGLERVDWGTFNPDAWTDPIPPSGFNKVVSNANLCSLLSNVADAVFPYATDDKLIFKQIRIVEDGTESNVQYEAVWVPSGSMYYADIVHYMGFQYPYATLWDEQQGKIIYPVEIEFIGIKELRIWIMPGSVPNDMTLCIAGQGSTWSSSSSSSSTSESIAGLRITEDTQIRITEVGVLERRQIE